MPRVLGNLGRRSGKHPMTAWRHGLHKAFVIDEKPLKLKPPEQLGQLLM